MKERPKTWPVNKLAKDGKRTKVDIPIDDLPFFMCMPTFKTNPAIQGSIPNGHSASVENGSILFSEKPELISERLQKYGANELSVTFDHLAFARMLAKIALAYCVAEFGYDGFTPMVSPLILGHTNGFPNIVSSSQAAPEEGVLELPLERRFEHQLLHKIAADTKTVCVRIDLFKNIRGPSYYVMAGVKEGVVLQWQTNS